MALVYIGVGSNLGDRAAYLDAALHSVGSLGTLVGGAPIYETAPIGPTNQDAYLNTVLSLETSVAPGDLLTDLLSIEREHGRVRDEKWGARTLDLDLLLYDDVRVKDIGIEVPHREIRNRRFVLAPLLDLDPSLGDERGAYATSLARVSDQSIRRLSGPVQVAENRWLEGLSDAIALEHVATDTWAFTTHRDWANSGGDMFGAYLTAASLFAARVATPEMTPTSMTHRFLHSVPPNVTCTVSLTVDRKTSRSINATVALSVDGTTMGHTTIGLVADVAAVLTAPTMPSVGDLSVTQPVERIANSVGISVGASARNWSPLEDWVDPGLDGGNSEVLRLWSPNVAIGSADTFMTAAALLMPMDAAIWPQTMNDMGLLPNGPAISTPTIELSANFGDLADHDLHHLAEASIDHRTASSVSATVRVWGSDGAYRGTGHSQNLILERDPYSIP